MKKSVIVVFIVLVLLTLLKLEPQEKEEEKKQEEVRAIYISYIELNEYLGDKPQEEQQKQIDAMIENVKNDQFNWILLHVRSFSDSLYPSSVFPTNYMVTRDEEVSLEWDVLAYFIEKAHQNNIQIHAWINPFRIRNETDASTISVKNPCFKWLGTNHVKKIEGKGIYYNPASLEAQQLILAGIKEIVENYEVDGIHFDDYFYPDDTIDQENYQAYQEEGGSLSKSKYRLQVINQFIQKVYQTVKESNQNVLFGIAPDGNIDNNYNKNYADILTWVGEKGYVDYIMPQLYYGFQNETKPYSTTLNQWNDYIKQEEIFFMPVLAFYKTGEVDQYAKSGSAEWQTHNNIIANQIQFARHTTHYHGFTIFRYDSLYGEKSKTREEEYQNFQTLLQK